MAVPLGTNDLKIYRRHIAACTRYPGLKKKPDTFKPNSKKEQMQDTCDCPIWCRGYLAKETEIVGDQIRPKRVFASLGCHKWTPAQKEVARLYERGAFPAVETGARPIDNSAVTVAHAATRYLESRTGASLNSIEKDTYAYYTSLTRNSGTFL